MTSPAETMRALNVAWLTQAAPLEHLYKHRWLGERFFHLPGDMVALQEVVWQVKPRLVIHTGVAAGGGPVFMASLLELVGGDGLVAAVDPAVRPEGRRACTEHALARRIRLIEGDSVDDEVVAQLEALAKDRGPVVVVLDLNHTHAHVLRELERLSPLVTEGSYVVVLDTVMEDLPAELFAGRPYGRGNNPGTAVKAFVAGSHEFNPLASRQRVELSDESGAGAPDFNPLASRQRVELSDESGAGAPDFVVDRQFEDRVLLTLAPGGFLRRVPRAARGL